MAKHVFGIDDLPSPLHRMALVVDLLGLLTTVENTGEVLARVLKDKYGVCCGETVVSAAKFRLAALDLPAHRPFALLDQTCLDAVRQRAT